MTELERLIAHAERIASTGERLSTVFAVELADVWRAYERALTPLAREAVGAGVLSMRNRVRELLTASGYDALAVAVSQEAINQMADVVLGPRDIPRADLEVRLEALRQIALQDLLAQGDESAVAVWRAVMQQAVTDRPVSQIIAALADALDRSQAGVRTLFDTQVSILGRQVEAIRTVDAPIDQPYLFAGPIDFKTRPFCLERVGKVFTRAEIDAMDNEQLPDVFLTGGGYSCRHSFLAVESQSLRDLSGTGERAPGYEADIERVAALKAARKRKAA